jgi:ethanolamine utilization protein EutN
VRIGKVIGNVTLSRAHDTFQGARLRLVVPLTFAELASGAEPQGESLVLWDDLNAGLGSTVCFSEGGEAVQPFKPEVKPVDAYLAAILDDVNLDRGTIEQLTNKRS